MKTIEQLEKEIRREKAKIALNQSYLKDKQKKKQLRNELIKLKYKKPIKVANKVIDSFTTLGRKLGDKLKKIEQQGKIKKPLNKKKRKEQNFEDLINIIP